MITMNTRITIPEDSDSKAYTLYIPQTQKEQWIIGLLSASYEKIDGIEIKDGNTTATITLNDDVPNADEGHIQVEHNGDQINIQMPWSRIIFVLQNLLDNYWNNTHFHHSLRYSREHGHFVNLTLLDQDDDSTQQLLHHAYTGFLLNIEGVSFQHMEEIKTSVTDATIFETQEEVICNTKSEWQALVDSFLRQHFECDQICFRSNELDGQAAFDDYWAIVDVVSPNEWTTTIARLSQHGLVRLLTKDFSKLFIINTNIFVRDIDFIGTITLMVR